MQKSCELGISVWDVGGFSGGVSERGDHVAEGQKPAVDGNPFFGAVSRRPSALQSLRTWNTVNNT